MKAFVATVAIATLTLAACGGDDSGGGNATETSSADGGGTAPSGSVDTTDLSSYDTIADLNNALADAGIDCALEYEGLTDDTHEISQCTIDGGQAVLTVWYDDGLLQSFLGADPPPEAVAYGANWTVELTSPDSAAAVADAAGGATTGG